jgi:hypothetical protein
MQSNPRGTAANIRASKRNRAAAESVSSPLVGADATAADTTAIAISSAASPTSRSGARVLLGKRAYLTGSATITDKTYESGPRSGLASEPTGSPEIPDRGALVSGPVRAMFRAPRTPDLPRGRAFPSSYTARASELREALPHDRDAITRLRPDTRLAGSSRPTVAIWASGPSAVRGPGPALARRLSAEK